MNNRLIKGILFDLNNVASYNNCGLDRLIRIEENNHELFGCKHCVYKEVADICPKLIKKEIEDVFYLR